MIYRRNGDAVWVLWDEAWKPPEPRPPDFSGCQHRVHEHLELYALARNLADAHYSSFGLVNRSAYSTPTENAERFLSPGAPIGAWAGFRISLLNPSVVTSRSSVPAVFDRMPA